MFSRIRSVVLVGGLAALVGMLLMGVAAVGAPIAGAAQRATFVTPSDRSIQDSIEVRPTSGPAGTRVGVKGSGFNTSCFIEVSFTDADGLKTWLAKLPPESTFKINTSVPIGSAPGPAAFSAQQPVYGNFCHPYPCCARAIPVSAAFTVTP